jgi:hypothetical protein
MIIIEALIIYIFLIEFKCNLIQIPNFEHSSTFPISSIQTNAQKTINNSLKEKLTNQTIFRYRNNK